MPCRRGADCALSLQWLTTHIRCSERVAVTVSGDRGLTCPALEAARRVQAPKAFDGPGSPFASRDTAAAGGVGPKVSSACLPPTQERILPTAGLAEFLSTHVCTLQPEAASSVSVPHTLPCVMQP